VLAIEENLIYIKDSSFINKMFYNDKTLTLYVLFQNGITYKYANVTGKEFLKFVKLKEDGSAVGKLFSSKIKNSKEFIKF